MVKNFKLNNKGMTLIELLAVIVILGIIGAIAVFNITQVIQTSKDRAIVSIALGMSESARMYLHTKSLDNEVSPNTITYKMLYNENYLEIIRDPDTGETLDPELNTSYAKFNGKKITAVCFKGAKRSLCTDETLEDGNLHETLSTDLITANN